jgi:uncharacterized membrane protein
VLKGSVWYIIGSTFKIGPIFYLPAILLIITKMRGLIKVGLFVISIIIVHILIAIPFISVNSEPYFSQNFNIGTRYMRWNSATWSFLKPEFYHCEQRRYAHTFLLLLSLLYSLFKKWTIPGKFLLDVRLLNPFSTESKTLDPHIIANIMA